MSSAETSTVGTGVRFGIFEADFSSGELWKHGNPVRVQSLPFKVLSILLERPGQVVTRDELQRRLWGNEVAVDFDRCLGTAVNKLREALGDSADKPLYIETLPKRGFRFIAPVQVVTPHSEETRAATIEPSPGEVCTLNVPAHVAETDARAADRPVVSAKLSRGQIVALFSLAAFLFLVLFAWASVTIASTRRVAQISRVTWSDRVAPGDISIENISRISSDGTRIYFLEATKGQFAVVKASPVDGETHPVPIPPEISRPSVSDVSRDGARLLVQARPWSQVERPFWIVSAPGNSALKLGNILAHDAVWTPDGKHILYATGNDLFLVDSDGHDSRKLAALPGRAFWLRYSPAGDRIRFTLVEPTRRITSLWEIRADGSGPRPLLSGWNSPAAECCGNWTSDGRFYVFQSTREGRTNIWGLRDGWNSFIPGFGDPIQISAGPIDFQSPLPDQRSNRIFVIGTDLRPRTTDSGQHSNSFLWRYDLGSRRFVPYFPEFNTAILAELSKDGSRLAWVNSTDGSLWQSRMDGSQRQRLISFPLHIFMVRWSPDGKTILVMGKKPGDPWKIYAVPADGGTVKPLLDEPYSQADPQWTPDGRTVIYGRSILFWADDATEKAIYSFNLDTKTVTAVPGSTGLFSPRVSPDGHYIAAMPIGQRRLMIFDFAKQEWSLLTDKSVDNPEWSADGKWIYFHAFMEEGHPIYRINAFDHRIERVADFDVQPGEVFDYLGLTGRDELVVRFFIRTANIYTIEFE